ncbi:MAG: DUF1302 family protein [Deltaproteobacteria bacterium]|nr:DUF1302 family protein [Candidatus Tharpella sp.]
MRNPGPAKNILTLTTMLILFIFIIIATPAAAQEQATPKMRYEFSENFTFKGWIVGLGAVDTHDDNDTEHTNLFRNRIRVESDWHHTLSPDNRLKAKFSLDSDYLYMGGGEKSNHEYDFTIFEGYLLYAHKNLSMTVGKQIVRWGKTDQLSPVDNINPQDLRLFILPELEDRKIPIWMLKLQGFGDNWSWEALYIPWFENSDIDYFNSDWAIFRHLPEEIKASNLPPEFKDYADHVLIIDRDKPANTLGNGEFGGRISFTAGQIDFSFSYLYGWENQPNIESFPIKNLNVDGSFSGDDIEDLPNQPDLIFTDERIAITYKRQQVAGLEFETTIGCFGLRGEAAYFDHMSFLASDLTSTRKPVFHTVLGLDYTSATDWYFNTQFSWMKILSYSSRILYFEDDNLALMGEISKPLFDHNLELRLRYNYTLSDGSYYLEPSITLKYFTNIEIELAANILGGDKDTLFGSFKENDQLFLRAKYYF